MASGSHTPSSVMPLLDLGRLAAARHGHLPVGIKALLEA
jgi:hypothetical protein